MGILTPPPLLDWTFTMSTTTGTYDSLTCGDTVEGSPKTITLSEPNLALLDGKEEGERWSIREHESFRSRRSSTPPSLLLEPTHTPHSAGTWTLIYDQGIEVQLGDASQVLFFYFDYATDEATGDVTRCA